MEDDTRELAKATKVRTGKVNELVKQREDFEKGIAEVEKNVKELD